MQCRVVQRYFDMWPGGTGNWTTDPVIHRQLVNYCQMVWNNTNLKTGKNWEQTGKKLDA